MLYADYHAFRTVIRRQMYQKYNVWSVIALIFHRAGGLRSSERITIVESKRYRLMSSTNNASKETILATVVRNGDAPDECTLHPVNPTTKERTTVWITAKEGSYLSLSSCV